MKITLNDKKLKVNEWTIQRIEQKLNKLDRYFKSDAVATVRLSEERGRYIAEVTVHAGSMVYRAQDKSGDVIASFDAAVDAIDRQIRKNKTRLTKKLRDSIRIPEEAVAVPEEDEFEIRTKTFKVKPMTAEEAILQMNQLGHEFFVFKDIDSGETCVVYKRKAGDYGLIIPE